jgi:hypothetical protein
MALSAWRRAEGAASSFRPDCGFKSRLRDRDSETIVAIELLLKGFAAGCRQYRPRCTWWPRDSPAQKRCGVEPGPVEAGGRHAAGVERAILRISSPLNVVHNNRPMAAKTARVDTCTLHAWIGAFRGSLPSVLGPSAPFPVRQRRRRAARTRSVLRPDIDVGVETFDGARKWIG